MAGAGQGKSPQFSKEHTGRGFKWGIEQRVSASRSASPMPKGIKDRTKLSIKPGVWNENASKP